MDLIKRLDILGYMVRPWGITALLDLLRREAKLVSEWMMDDGTKW